ncbi:MAG: Asp-tRNA(Asn)/Glu-tRNA(Gln) amidotransferase subunit GatC [Verrucomicrobiales bacterium]
MSAPSLDVAHTAKLSRLDLSPEEIATFQGQLDKILAYVEKLTELDVEGIEPTAHASPVFDVMRDDVARPGFGVENALMNAPRRVGDQFGVPKVIE